VRQRCRTGRALLRTAKPAPGALPPAVDLELAGNCKQRPETAIVKAELAAFLAAVEAAWQRRVLLYVGADWQGRYPVVDEPSRPRWKVSFFGRPDESWAVWQLHGFARVDGIDGRVDLDVARLHRLDRTA